MKMARISKGRRKIDITYIADKNRRHITFSKRKGGIVKKGQELSVLTGTDMIIVMASEAGSVYYFSSGRFSNSLEVPGLRQCIHETLQSASRESQPHDFKFIRMNPPDQSSAQDLSSCDPPSPADVEQNEVHLYAPTEQLNGNNDPVVKNESGGKDSQTKKVEGQHSVQNCPNNKAGSIHFKSLPQLGHDERNLHSKYAWKTEKQATHGQANDGITYNLDQRLIHRDNHYNQTIGDHVNVHAQLRDHIHLPRKEIFFNQLQSPQECARLVQKSSSAESSTSFLPPVDCASQIRNPPCNTFRQTMRDFNIEQGPLSRCLYRQQSQDLQYSDPNICMTNIHQHNYSDSYHNPVAPGFSDSARSGLEHHWRGSESLDSSGVAFQLQSGRTGAEGNSYQNFNAGTDCSAGQRYRLDEMTRQQYPRTPVSANGYLPHTYIGKGASYRSNNNHIAHPRDLNTSNGNIYGFDRTGSFLSGNTEGDASSPAVQVHTGLDIYKSVSKGNMGNVFKGCSGDGLIQFEPGSALRIPSSLSGVQQQQQYTRGNILLDVSSQSPGSLGRSPPISLLAHSTTSFAEPVDVAKQLGMSTGIRTSPYPQASVANTAMPLSPYSTPYSTLSPCSAGGTGVEFLGLNLPCGPQARSSVPAASTIAGCPQSFNATAGGIRRLWGMSGNSNISRYQVDDQNGVGNSAASAILALNVDACDVPWSESGNIASLYSMPNGEG